MDEDLRTLNIPMITSIVDMVCGLLILLSEQSVFDLPQFWALCLSQRDLWCDCTGFTKILSYFTISQSHFRFIFLSNPPFMSHGCGLTTSGYQTPFFLRTETQPVRRQLSGCARTLKQRDVCTHFTGHFE